MLLSLPRSFPECLTRNVFSFGFLGTYYFTTIPVAVVRSLDSVFDPTLLHLLDCAHEHQLVPFSEFPHQFRMYFNVTNAVSLNTGHCSQRGFLVSKFVGTKVFGCEYSRSGETNEFKIQHESSLPSFIPLGFDILFVNSALLKK